MLSKSTHPPRCVRHDLRDRRPGGVAPPHRARRCVEQAQAPVRAPGEEPFSIWRNFHGRSLDVVGLAQRGAAGFPGAGIVAEHRAGAAHEQTVRATRFEAHQHAPRRGAPDRHLAFSLRPEIARHWCPRRHIPQPHRAFPCPHQHAGTVVIERRFEDPGQICPSVRRQRRTGQTSGPKAPAKADAEKGWDGRP